MRLLLDSHVLLWWLADDPNLPPRARATIADSATSVLVSAATVWELAIKRAAGRLETPDHLLEVLQANKFESLPIASAHALKAAALPHHHADPFDRMLIAQAQHEGLTLASVDRRFGAYDIDLLPLT